MILTFALTRMIKLILTKNVSRCYLTMLLLILSRVQRDFGDEDNINIKNSYHE